MSPKKQGSGTHTRTPSSKELYRSVVAPAMTWLDLPNPQRNVLNRFQEEHRLHPLDIEDCLSPAQRPKLVIHPHYLFLILLFPVYDSAQREVVASEIDFFLFATTVITVHRNTHPIFDHLIAECRQDPIRREQLLDGNPATLLYELLHGLFQGVFPMLKHITVDLRGAEQQIFAGREKQMAREILTLRRTITDVRVALQAHRAVIQKLLDHTPQFFSTARLQLYYRNLLEQTEDIRDILDNHKEHIEALQETNESLISFRLNDIMRLLTGISVALLPVTLIASIFSMNTPMPFLSQNPYGFPMALVIITAVGIAMVTYFKRRQWL